MILFRYLAKEILMTMLAVSVSLLVIVMSGRFVKYLAQAASGDLAPALVFSIMAYRIPSFLELVLPLGLFIGILLAYGRLYVESEMTVMSACGLSTTRLALYTLIPSIVVAMVVGYMSMVASPDGIAKVQEVFVDAKNASGLETLAEGRFRTDDKSGRVVYVEQLINDRKVMRNVFSAQPQKDRAGKHQLSVIYAAQGKIVTDTDWNANYLVLEDGFRYIGQPGEREFSITQFARFGQLLRESETRQQAYKKVDARSTQALFESERLEDKAALQWRVSLVLLVPIIALIAQALSRTNHRRGRYVKMLPAFLIYIIYLVLLNAARDAIEKEKIPLEVGMWWVHILFFLLALVLLFGGDWLRRLKAKTVNA